MIGDIIAIYLAWWFVTIPATLAILGATWEAVTGTFGFFAGIPERRHRRRLELLREQRKLERARHRQQDGALPATREEPATPGPCPHRPRNVKPVFDALGNHTAYLCTACDAQLDKNWAVQEEDL